MSLLSDNLKAFLHICEVGTVLGASKAMGLTQTALTQRIRSLENQLQVTLFIRSRKGMTPTKEGLEILAYCKNANRLESELLHFNKEHDLIRKVEIKLCGPTSLIRSTITPRLSQLLKKYKNLSLNIKADDLEDRITKLKNGSVDFAFIRSDLVPNEIEGKQLKANKFYLVGPASWKNRTIKDILAHERSIIFDPRDDLTKKYLEKFRLEAYARNEYHSINSLDSLIELVEDGHGYGLLEESFIEQFVSKKKIFILNHEKFLENRMALCWMPKTIYSKVFTDIINLF